MNNGANRFRISASANSIPIDSIDCGVKLLGWCNSPRWQKLAKIKTFLITLSIFGLLQGACETYFRISTKQAFLAADYDPLIVDWLLVSNGLFQAMFAILFSYWAHQYHPISWLGGTVMLQAVSCFIAILPTITNLTTDSIYTSSNYQPADNALCTKSLETSKRSMLNSSQSEALTIVLLYVLQLGLGLGSLAFYTIGVTYIDDNSDSLDSAAAIATAVGSRIFGFLLGTAISLIIGVNLASTWWIGWAFLAPTLFLNGIFLGLFPLRLTKTVVRQAAQQIIEESSMGVSSHLTSFIDDTAFVATIKRIFRNKLLICNVLGIMFIQAAVINYLLQEENYLQSRFFMPISEIDGLMQEWQARFVSYFLKPPIVAVSMLLGGLSISKLKLSARAITGINVALGILLFFIYISYIFIKCNVGPIAGITNGKLVQPYCSRQCICSSSVFLPICPENSSVTFFSPCYAGCTTETHINNIQIYEGCSCGAVDDFETISSNMDDSRATGGACNVTDCAKMWFLFQALSLIAAAIYGITAVGKIIISLRSVLPQDKAMALAVEAMFVCFFAYIPVKLLYDTVSTNNCLYWTLEHSKCLLRENPKHGNYLNLLSAGLILIGVVFDICVFIFAKGLNIYNCKITDLNYTPLYAPYAPIRSGVDSTDARTVSAPTAETQRLTTLTTVRPMSTFRSIFRSSSSVTSPSVEQVTYAQIVTADRTSSPELKRSDHNLTVSTVRNQRSKLKPITKNAGSLKLDDATANESAIDDIRPQSPETNL